MVNYEELGFKGLDAGSFLKGVAESEGLEDIIKKHLVEYIKYSPNWASKLAYMYKNDVAEMLRNLSKLMTLITKVGLDPNWLIAAVSLAIQDIYVQKIAIELKLNVQKPDGTYRNTPELLGLIVQSTPKKPGVKTTELKVAKAYSEDYRNEVIHKGLRVSEDKALDIMRATSNLIDALSAIQASNKSNV